MNPDTVNHDVSSRLLEDTDIAKTGNDQIEPTKPAHPNTKKPESVRFWHQIYIPLAVIIYVGLLLAAWLILCLLSRDMVVRAPDSEEYFTINSISIQNYMATFNDWYRAANLLWSIVAVATLPLASAVCSFAAVGFIQSQRYRKPDLTLRQTLNIADRGWTNPTVVFSMFWQPKKHGSSLLYIALLLHILGAILNPLQSLLVNQTRIKKPLRVRQGETVADIYALTNPTYLSERESGYTVAALRSTLASARPTDTYQNLWPANSSCISCPAYACGVVDPTPFNCQNARTNIQDVAVVTGTEPTLNLYMSAVSTSTNTGLLRQYAPRINSSVTWDSVSADEFPTNCSGTAFFKNYTLSPHKKKYSEYWYSISACMMGNLSHTPFQRTRDRQDFNETLFITTNAYRAKSNTIHLTLSTTLGYFELPNDMLNGTAGPLLEKDPMSNCTGTSCDMSAQTHGLTPQSQDIDQSDSRADGWVDGTFYLDYVASKGPLALITLALFGQKSTLDPSLYRELDAINSTNAAQDVCYTYQPLAFLLSGSATYIPMACDGLSDQSGFQWIKYFTDPNRGIPALSQAAFLANKALFDVAWGGSIDFDDQLIVNYQPGFELTKPDISVAAMIGLSVLISIYVFMLIGLCVANLTQAPWTGSVNSHSIMKITAALCATFLKNDEEQLMSKDDDILDFLPGHVGDAEPDAKVGRLAVGAEAPLKMRRRYWKGDEFGI